MKRKSPQFRKISETHRKIATAACEVIALPDSHCCTILENISEGVFTIDLTYTGHHAERVLLMHFLHERIKLDKTELFIEGVGYK